MEIIVEDSIIYNITENVTQVAVTQFFGGDLVPYGTYNITILFNMINLIVLNSVIFSNDLFPLNSWHNIPCNHITYIDLPPNSTYFGTMLMRTHSINRRQIRRRIRRYVNDPTRSWRYKLQFKK